MRKYFSVLLICFAVILIASPASAQDALDGAVKISPVESDSILEAGGLSATIIQIFLVVTVLSLAPGIAMLVTCLPFILIVLSILRQGIGLQQAPPNMLIVGVAMFLTYFVMEPVFKEAWVTGVGPLINQEVTQEEAIPLITAPFREFMVGRAAPEAIEILADARAMPVAIDDDPLPLSLLIPAFILSEIQHAFVIGFVILLPFLVIDIVVASILMAMGMMMVPPSIVSLPFKVGFFVLTNGWVVVSGALVRGYS